MEFEFWAWDVLGWVIPIAFACWLLKPYLVWRLSCGYPLESYLRKTSFQCGPHDLVAPPWSRPELSLSVIIPAFEEEFRLPQMLDETFSYLDDRVASRAPGSFTYEVIVVDDGSGDRTYVAALDARNGARGGAGLRVLQLDSNKGKGFAVRAGMLAARGELLLMADADGASSIRDFERLERALERPASNGSITQIAFGSRHHLQAEAIAKRSWIRNALMFGFHWLVWILLGSSIRDTQCGFKLFRSRAGKSIFRSLHLFRWAFDVEILLLANMIGASVVEVPVTWVEMPLSKFFLAIDALAMLRDILMLRLLYLVGVWGPQLTPD